MMAAHLRHSVRLARMLLRQDRLRITLWVVALAGMTWLTAGALGGLYGDAQERQAIAETMANPGMTAMLGIGYGLADYTIGAMLAHQMLLLTAVVAGIMNILLVARYTRGDEEEGRTEMLRALPVGRLAALHAAVIVIVGVNLVLALVTGMGLYAMGVSGIELDLEGSLLYGAALGACGLCFAAITAVCAQLAEHTRSALGLSIGALLAAYLIRAVGDVGEEAVAWLSPLGWLTRTKVYVSNAWGPVALTVAAAGLLLSLAYYLCATRDLGAGMLRARAGRRRASRGLLLPHGLPWRLQRTGFIAWGVGMLVIGTSYGSVLGDLDAFFSTNERLQEMIRVTEGVSLTEQFIAMLLTVMAMICAIPPVISILRLCGEEKRGRLSHLAAGAVSRQAIMLRFLVLAVASSCAMLVFATLGMGVVAQTAMGNSGNLDNMDNSLALSVGTLVLAGLAYLPALWVMVGLSAFLVGWLPRFAGWIWLYLVYAFVVVYMGGLLQLPEAFGRLTPFGHVPAVPVDEWQVGPALGLVAVAAVLTAAGVWGFRRRDLQG